MARWQKENEETQTNKAIGQTIMDKPSHKIPIKQREKEMEKGPKEIGKGKGKPRCGNRKVAWKDEKSQQDNETKPVTNNMQNFRCKIVLKFLRVLFG
jgi:hypothetical protein